MKKILLFAGAALALTFAACDNHGAGKANFEGFDSLFSQSKADSLVLAIAEASGSQLREQFIRVQEQDPSLSRDVFMKGFKYAMAADSATAYGYGMQSGMQLGFQLRQLEAKGLRVNRKAFMACFSKYFMADSADQIQASMAQEMASSLSRQLNQAEQIYKEAQVEKSPVSLENIAKGRQVVDSLIANEGYQATASGVAYKVLQPGEGENIQAKDRVKMAYTAKTLDGRVYDEATPDNARVQAVTTRIPGLQEGLQKLNQGSKAIIYIPGSEAYGTNMNGRYNLGPNETVVYEVEIIEIEQK